MKRCPLVFEPICKPKIWGGRRLETLLGKRLPLGEKIGEVWEVADLEEDQSIVARGPAKGRALAQLVREWGADLLGDAALVAGRFPLLIKYLDAADNLSVQVHPGEATVYLRGIEWDFFMDIVSPEVNVQISAEVIGYEDVQARPVMVVVTRHP